MRRTRLVAAAPGNSSAHPGSASHLRTTRTILGRLPHVRAIGGCRRKLPALAVPAHEDGGTHHRSQAGNGRIVRRFVFAKSARADVFSRVAGSAHRDWNLKFAHGPFAQPRSFSS